MKAFEAIRNFVSGKLFWAESYKRYRKHVRPSYSLYGRLHYWLDWFSAERDYEEALVCNNPGRMRFIREYHWTRKLAAAHDFDAEHIVAEAEWAIETNRIIERCAKMGFFINEKTLAR